jgi:acyl-CoA synthetase (AMP-forming)/AMP-acid ligase II
MSRSDMPHTGEAEILALCREHLAAYKVPKAVQFVHDLPRKSTLFLYRSSRVEFGGFPRQFVSSRKHLC